MKRYFLFIKFSALSLWYRRSAVAMAILSVTTSVFVLIGVEHIRNEARENFTNTLSDIDLIVGPRTGHVNLLLYSVFRIGDPTNSMSWNSVQAIIDHSNVAWTIPISLGDSHRGFRVVGTTDAFFSHFHYRSGQSIQFLKGKEFTSATEVVLGSAVARDLKYQLNDELVLSHGISKHSFSMHEDQPFRVTGIIERTGTPVDNALYVPLEGIEAIHRHWHGGRAPFNRGGADTHDRSARAADSKPEKITALMLGLSSKLATFKVQRWVNEFNPEPLTAILPGVALVELWQLMNTIEQVLVLISALIFVAAMFGVAAMLLSSMREREHELFVLRSLGASVWVNYVLITCEALLIVLLGALFAMVLLLTALFILNEVFSSSVGMMFSYNLFGTNTFIALGAMLMSIFVICIIPMIKVYKLTRQR